MGRHSLRQPLLKALSDFVASGINPQTSPLESANVIADKPIFRDSFKRLRCLIPASGYYEWQDTPSGKQPYYFTRRDGQIITIAGLWSKWTNKATGADLHSCTLVVTEPNKIAVEVHDRMQVILEAKDFAQWERGNVKDAAMLMKPAADDVLRKWPVSKRVNSSRASDEDETLISQV